LREKQFQRNWNRLFLGLWFWYCLVYTFEDLVYKTSRKANGPSWLPPYFIHLPVPLALIQAAIFERIFPPGNPMRISRDQIRMLQLGKHVHQQI
jgi:hypothetical protein